MVYCSIIIILLLLTQASTSRRRCADGPKTQPAAECSSAVGVHSKADVPLEKDSRISCECHHFSGRRRCSASPEVESQEGKENALRARLEPEGRKGNGARDKRESEDMDCEETSKNVGNIFPDDDSNQILPVEQFFGNLDAVQVRHLFFIIFSSLPWGHSVTQVGLFSL